MARITKAELLLETEALVAMQQGLEVRLASLEAENTQLKLQVAALQQPKQVPSVGSVVKISFTPDNPIFDGLPRFMPHSKITCRTHGKSQANKIGICTLCACEKARGGRLAA